MLIMASIGCFQIGFVHAVLYTYSILLSFSITVAATVIGGPDNVTDMGYQYCFQSFRNLTDLNDVGCQCSLGE